MRKKQYPPPRLSFRASLTVGCLLGVLAGTSALHGDSVSVDNLVAKAAENYAARATRSDDYVYSERIQNINYDGQGKVVLRVSDSYDIVVVEGAPYRIRTAHNDQPLSAGDEKKENEKLAAVTKARRSGDRRMGGPTHSLAFTMPIAQLSSEFDLRSNGQEQIGGRECELVRATTKPDYKPENEDDRVASLLELRLWIDLQDVEIAKVQAQVIGEGSRYKPGTVITHEFTKINNEVWLRKRLHLHGYVRDGRQQVLVDTEQAYSDYKKFRVN